MSSLNNIFVTLPFIAIGVLLGCKTFDSSLYGDLSTPQQTEEVKRVLAPYVKNFDLGLSHPFDSPSLFDTESYKIDFGDAWAEAAQELLVNGLEHSWNTDNSFPTISEVNQSHELNIYHYKINFYKGGSLLGEVTWRIDPQCTPDAARSILILGATKIEPKNSGEQETQHNETPRSLYSLHPMVLADRVYPALGGIDSIKAGYLRIEAIDNPGRPHPHYEQLMAPRQDQVSAPNPFINDDIRSPGTNEDRLRERADAPDLFGSLMLSRQEARETESEFSGGRQLFANPSITRLLINPFNNEQLKERPEWRSEERPLVIGQCLRNCGLLHQLPELLAIDPVTFEPKHIITTEIQIEHAQRITVANEQGWRHSLGFIEGGRCSMVGSSR